MGNWELTWACIEAHCLPNLCCLGLAVCAAAVLVFFLSPLLTLISNFCVFAALNFDHYVLLWVLSKPGMGLDSRAQLAGLGEQQSDVLWPLTLLKEDYHACRVGPMTRPWFGPFQWKK